VSEEWAGAGGLRETLEKDGYCSKNVGEMHSVATIKNAAACQEFYAWAAASKHTDQKRCEALNKLRKTGENMLKLTADTRGLCKLSSDGKKCGVQGRDCKYVPGKSTAATCLFKAPNSTMIATSACSVVAATCTGTHDGSKNNGTAGEPCGINPTKTGCKVKGGNCNFTQAKCGNSNCTFTAASATPAKCDGKYDGTGRKSYCPAAQCRLTQYEMALDCRKIIKPQPNGYKPCDETPKFVHAASCVDCDKACQAKFVDDLQTAMSALPFFCYFIFFFLNIALVYNVFLIDMADDIETFHAFMEMEASTLGVAHFIENPPKFEGTPLQQRGILVNVFGAFLGFLVICVGLYVLFGASEHFGSLGAYILVDGGILLGLEIAITMSVKQNNMPLVKLCNLTLFTFGFLTLVLGIVCQLATGSVSDLHTKIDEDYDTILSEIEWEEPAYCGPKNARLSTSACKGKIVTEMQDSVEIVAYVGVILVALMTVLMWLTHNMAGEYYRGHRGEDDVPGGIDNKIKKKIESKSDHARRLSPEDMATIEKWKMARKEGKDGLDKASNAELELLVIGSCHPDDNVKPHNEEAQKFLEHGDLFIGEGKCVAAGIKYQHGRDIEPGNPQLKQRADAIRRYLTQRGELDKMISKYKSEVAQMNVAKEAEEQGFEAPEDMENDANDFFNKNKDKGSQKKTNEKKKKISDQVAEMEIADE